MGEPAPKRGVTLNVQTLATIGTVIIVVLVGLNAYGRITTLEQRATTLEVEFQQLEQFKAILEDVERQVADIQAAREDIIRAVCEAVGREPQQCGLVPDPVPPP